MSKIHRAHVQHRERLFSMLAEMLLDSRQHRIKDAAERYGVSQEKIRRDIKYLEEKLNRTNRREYIIRGHGYYQGNFARAVANLSPEVRLYLFLALRQVQPLLKGEGERAYQELLEYTYSVLREEDVRRLKEWSGFYFVSEYGFPRNRIHFYRALQDVFEAIRYDQILQLEHRGPRRYFDPYGVYYAKHLFYLIGKLVKWPDGPDLPLIHLRLDRIRDISRMPRPSSLGRRKKEDIWEYKRNHAEKYINQMLEAEHSKVKQDYVIRIYDPNVFERIREKQWHPYQQIREIHEKGAVGEIVFPKISSWLEIKKWVLGWGSAVELVKPAEKRKELRNEIQAMFYNRYQS